MCGIFSFILKRPLNKKEGVYIGHTEIINDKFNGWLCDINNMTDTTNLVLKIIKDKKYLEHIIENAFFLQKKILILKIT